MYIWFVIIQHYHYNHHNHVENAFFLLSFVTYSFGRYALKTVCCVCFFFFFNLNDTSSAPQSPIKSLLALFCQVGYFTPGLVWNSRAHLQWTRFHTPARGLCDNRRFIVWNLSGIISDLQSFPIVAVFGGLSAHRLHGHPNPHKRSNQTTLGWSDQRHPVD